MVVIIPIALSLLNYSQFSDLEQSTLSAIESPSWTDNVFQSLAHNLGIFQNSVHAFAISHPKLHQAIKGKFDPLVVKFQTKCLDLEDRLVQVLYPCMLLLNT